jgi:hypothetical protein
MFILKLILGLVIILFIFYNGVSIMSNDTGYSEKIMSLVIYLLFFVIIGNIVFSFVTYYHTKHKQGKIGTVGIRGQKGQTGEDGTCDAKCGLKVCQLYLMEEANKVLNEEIKDKKIIYTIPEVLKNTDKIEIKNKIKNLFDIPLTDISETTDSYYLNHVVEKGKDISINIQRVKIRPTIKRLKIRNQDFINKISKICNSPEYKDILEKPHKNKPTELKLINYLKGIVGKWIRLILSYKQTGLGFILTKDSTFEVFNKELLNELKKYDVWNWNELYNNVPILVEKYNKEQSKPDKLEPVLGMVKSNNYNKIYTSQESDSIWYSNDNYCPFNQLVDKNKKNTNPNNLTDCIYYKTNEQGHNYLKGKQPAWKEIEYLKTEPLTLYHPKKTEDGLYHTDEHGRQYFPVGSVWTGKIDNNVRENKNNFTPKSKNKCSNHSNVGPEKETILVTGDVVDPLDYELLWDNTGCSECQQKEPEASIWKPISPANYICMGNVVKTGTDKPTLTENLIKCLPEKCVAKIPIGKEIWDTKNLIKKNFGETTFDIIDTFYITLHKEVKKINYNELSKFKLDINDIYQIIDDMITNETDEQNIKKLRSIKKDVFIIDWPIKTRNDINKNKNLSLMVDIDGKLDTIISQIYKKYASKYNKLKDKGSAEIEGKKFSIEANNITIYVGPSSSNTKTVHLPLTNLEIDNVISKPTSVTYNYNIVDRTLIVKRTNPVSSRPGWTDNLTLTASIQNSFRDHKNPIITKSKPLKLYSAGAQDALEETVNRSNLTIEDDEGHNLFMGSKDNNIPKFAYKIKKECLFPKIAKPIKVNTIPGVLDDFDSERDKRQKAEPYFTYPMNIIIESNLGAKNSPLGEPKKYYLTYINKKGVGDNEYPIYIIRAIDESTMDYSKFKVINKNKQIVNMPIDTNNVNGKWTIRHITRSTLETKEDTDHSTLTDKTIVLESISNNGFYFNHHYDELGNSLEELKNNTTSLSGQWIYHKLQ